MGCSNHKKTWVLQGHTLSRRRASPSAVVGRVGGPRMGEYRERCLFQRVQSWPCCPCTSKHRRRHWSSRGSIESLGCPRWNNVPCKTHPFEISFARGAPLVSPVCPSGLPSRPVPQYTATASTCKTTLLLSHMQPRASGATCLCSCRDLHIAVILELCYRCLLVQPCCLRSHRSRPEEAPRLLHSVHTSLNTTSQPQYAAV